MITNWTDFDAVLRESLPGYQTRPVQEAAANAALRAFGSDRHFLAQLTTGSGKSFIGCAVGYINAVKSGKPTVIGTETKALQDQLAEKDLPFLAEHIPGLKYAVLKGRGNYVCRQKVEETENRSLKDAALAAFDDEKFSGEIVDLGRDDAVELATTSDECPGKKDCPFGEICFAEKAKAKAKDSHIVVANHAVIAADMAVKSNQEKMGVPENKTVGILPHWDTMILDEGHGWQDSVTNALGGEVTAGSFGRLAKEVANFLNDHRDNRIESAAMAAFNEVARILNTREDKRNKTLPLESKHLVKLGPSLIELVEALSKVTATVESTQIHGDDKKVQKRKRLVRRLENTMLKVQEIIAAADEALVRWLEEGEGRKGNSVAWAPLDVSEFLIDNLWTRGHVMMMSATLSMGNDFSFLIEQLGIPTPDTFNGESPFDFAKQALTFIPQIAVPSGSTLNAWRAASIATMSELVRASDGRALLLFTSKTEMEAAYTAVSPMIKRMGHVALKQGQAPNKVLMQQFKDDEHSVLFALKSFMTGADFQGDTLRLVWINKLPFPVPSDVVLQARVRLQDKRARGWNDKGFNKITVPLMALLLLQAYGRAIRTVSDKAVVAIGDPRLYGKESKSYGARIMAALPNAPVTTSLDEAVTFLEGMS